MRYRTEVPHKNVSLIVEDTRRLLDEDSFCRDPKIVNYVYLTYMLVLVPLFTWPLVPCLLKELFNNA